jgi:hypothetical protein
MSASRDGRQERELVAFVKRRVEQGVFAVDGYDGSFGKTGEAGIAEAKLRQSRRSRAARSYFDLGLTDTGQIAIECEEQKADAHDRS